MVQKGQFINDGIPRERRDYARVLDAVHLQVSKQCAVADDGQAVVQPISSEPGDTPTHKVSLSGSGIAFASDVLLQPGDEVALGLTLFPSRQLLQLTGTVVSVGEAGVHVVGGPYAARVVFTELSEASRDLIVDHISAVHSAL
jgi:hypothetical protein